jgi:tetratricopeptide (TPR) repeat protein
VFFYDQMKDRFAPLLLLILAISCIPRQEPNASEYSAIQQKIADSIKGIHEKAGAFITISDSLLRKKKYDAALSYCDSALSIDAHYAKAHTQKGKVYRVHKKYTEAIACYEKALQFDDSLGQAWYECALCYVKKKQKREAVNDLKHAMTLRYPGADSLHEKINPLKKRISGVHSRCCDGTTSSSTGRGACSHHGGVCRTEYEYEEYREY